MMNAAENLKFGGKVLFCPRLGQLAEFICKFSNILAGKPLNLTSHHAGRSSTDGTGASGEFSFSNDPILGREADLILNQLVQWLLAAVFMGFDVD